MQHPHTRHDWPFYSSPPHPAHPFQPSYVAHHPSEDSTADDDSATVIQFPGSHRPTEVDVCQRLLNEFVSHARIGHSPSALRPSFLAIATIDDAREPLDGFANIAAAVTLEAAFSMTRRHFRLPPRKEFFAHSPIDD